MVEGSVFGSGSSSGVERKLPKLDVAGSIPVSRSIILPTKRAFIQATTPMVGSTLLQRAKGPRSLISGADLGLAGKLLTDASELGPDSP